MSQPKRRKEIQVKPDTQEHDLSRKMDQVEDFLVRGHSVLVICKPKGREMLHIETIKSNLLDRINQVVGRNRMFRISGKSSDGLSYILVRKESE